MGKIIEVRNLYKDTINDVAKNTDNWLSFLNSASYNFKYSFDDQILIYAQRPDAKACASMEIWNKKLKRWVNKNSRVIFVNAKEDSPYPYRMVFDVSDTHNYRNTSYKLWKVKKEYENEIIETLEESFGEITSKESLAQAINLSAYNMVMDNAQDYLLSIQNHKVGTELENMTDDEIQMMFIPTLWASVSYMMMKRCNITPDIDKSEFSFISKFNDENIITIFGTATSDIAEMGLREIAETVINLQKEEKNKNRTFVEKSNIDYSNNEKEIKGGKENDENRLQQTKRLYDTKYNVRGGETTNRQIRTNEIEIPKDSQESRVHDTLERQETSRTFDGDTGNSNKENSIDSRTNETTNEYNRGIESSRPDGMGRTDEQHSSNSRTDSNTRTNISIEENIEKEAENASFFDEETIKKILDNNPNVLKNKVEFGDFIYENHEDKEKCKQYIKEILGNAYTEFDIDSQRVGYKANEESLNIWKGNYLNRTEECFKSWDVITEYCISNHVHYITPEYNKDDYTFLVGDVIHLGLQEFTITDMNNGTITMYDNSFPLDQRTVVIKDIIQKIAENPLNDYLRDREIPEVEENSFNKWLDTFIAEKGIKLEDTFSLDGDESFHIFEVGNIIENIKIAPPEEQTQIKDMLVKIDFHNGSVIDYFKHLAQALVNNYEKEQQEQEKENQIKETTEIEKTQIEKNIADKLIKRNRNIEYFDLHPEIPTEERNNFKIQDDNLGVGTAKEKYKNNIEAIKVLKLCEEQDRYATLEEQKILSKYVGWGGLKSVFEDDNDSWSNEYFELKNLLTEDEYENARASSTTAYYTPPVVIRNIYKALQNMGLKQGNILEPSCRCW